MQTKESKVLRGRDTEHRRTTAALAPRRYILHHSAPIAGTSFFPSTRPDLDSRPRARNAPHDSDTRTTALARVLRGLMPWVPLRLKRAPVDQAAACVGELRAFFRNRTQRANIRRCSTWNILWHEPHSIHNGAARPLELKGASPRSPELLDAWPDASGQARGRSGDRERFVLWP